MKNAVAFLLIISMLILSACSGGAQSDVTVPDPVPESVSEPVPTAAPTPAPEPKSSVEALRERMEDYLCDKTEGEISVVVWDLETDDSFSLNNREDARQSRFAESLLKLYIMLAAYESEARGELDTSEYEYSLTRMIAVSDNEEANYITDEIGGVDKVNELIAPYGFSNTVLNKYIGLNLPGPENVSSVNDCAQLLHGLYTGALVSPEASRAMLDLLLQQEIRTKLPVPIPSEISIAHMTGEYLDEANHDVGIVFTRDGRSDYILCVMVNNVEENEARNINIELSSLAWDYFDSGENYVSAGLPGFSEAEYSCETAVSIMDGDRNCRPSDGDYATATWLAEDRAYPIVSHEPFSYLYLIWDSAPGEYTVDLGGETIIGGTKGYLHELLKFDEPVSSVTVRLKEKDAAVCELYAYSEGKLPDSVQDWQTMEGRADILIFPTHADDEMLFFGGLIPTYAGEYGQKVQVVFLTNHRIREPVRNHELLDALWHAGDVYYPVVSDFPDRYTLSLDEALELYDADEVIDFQVEMIRRFKPRAIYAHDEAGEYGHGVHQLNTYCLERAVVNAARDDVNLSSLNTYGSWDTPETWIHMYDENQVVMDWHIPLSRFGGKTALEIAREAYLFHKSQQVYDFEVLEYGEGDCRLFGLWRSAG